MGDSNPAKGLLLAVLPWPEEEVRDSLKQIEKEFPELEPQYFFEKHAEKESERGKFEVPDDLTARAVVLATLSWLPKTPEQAPNLKLIQCFSAGTNHLAAHPIYQTTNIPLTTVSGIHGPQIAEWVIMMDLIHSHKYLDFYEAQQRCEWSQARGMKIRDKVGKTVGVLGYGSIGRQVARLAHALSSTVIAYTASPRDTPESRRDNGFIVPGTGDADGSIPKKWFSGLEKEKLHEFLSEGMDLLVISVPLTKATTHLLSTPEFQTLHASNPHGTYIANISRGKILDQDALISALENNLIAGAALDVTDPEPLPKEHPLWRTKGVAITPHVSGLTDVYAQRGMMVLAENLRRWREGRELVNEVDRRRGY
ncbi:NAD(P)-binding protein [Westerdykella ornata]|uniref:NAD(P)-binding protein n=1 Tax=Westerdykella ornata TaxID=318751 RepID=A0A6A6J691_WESOR|nr:NAD(P)-binding protein [Westerdykella ornata]KAF2271945.1 NAD(P)-binding protein [Westerdykella ornata]